MSLCLSGCYCKSPMSKPVQVVSVIDMLASVVFVIYETTNFGLLTGLIQPKSEQNCTNCTTLSDFVPESVLSKFDFETFTVMTMIVLVFLGFIIEGCLYSKLKMGKRHKVHLFCKKWFELRIIFLLITVLMGVAKYLRGFYTLRYDGVIDAITKTYRIVSMFIVKCFMRELELEVGVVYVKPAKPRKRGSLSLK